jgi:LysM repeat protein
MKNIAQGLSLKKYKGNTHEQGGIMVNALGNKTKDVNKAVAEVEGGEYNYRYNPNNPKDNYILSEQLGIAGMAKQADRFKGNNRIDYNTRTNLLNKSMKLNEMLRVQQEQQPMQMAAFGGKLKKYINGGLTKGSQSIVDSMVANSKANDTTKVTTAPEIKLGTSNLKLETNPIALPTLPTTAPKTTAEAANTGMEVNTQNDATPQPVIEKNKKNNFKGALSAVSGAVSALGPIGQGVGAALQLAPYAIDLGKAMFDKTSVQDLQTQGSAMRLPNTTYAKNGGKLNVVPLPKFEDGTNINTEPVVTDPLNLYDTKKIFGEKIIKINDKTRNVLENLVSANNVINPDTLKKVSDLAQKQSGYTGELFVDDNYRKVLKNPDGTYKYVFNPVVQTKTDTPVNTTNTGKNKGVKPPLVVNDTPTAAEIEEAKKTRAKFKENPLTTLKTLPETIKSNKPGVNNITTLDTKKEMNIAKRAGLNVVPQSSKSESSKLFKAGQKKQKLSEALMYGMAALPSEQIKTITPDYGRGDDAMSRMGLSTEPIRQEMMQGANKALELTRSQVGTAGQLQSRGQSIMSNLSSQLSQSQIQQQQYLNQLRGALAQREDTKANVLAQSELTAREAKSAERAAKLDQLNNAISQTSAIGAGTMEQASKMSTIENENERFKRNQDFIRELANQGVSFEVDENGKIVFNNKVGSSNIKQADLSNPNPLVVKDNPVAPATTTTPKEHVVKQGEGLNAIAAQYKIPVDKLLKLNNLKIGDTIHPNQKLKIE